MVLQFQGVLEIDYDWDYDGGGGMATIGGRDVCLDVRRAAFSGPVTVAVMGESFSGDLSCWEHLAAYSESTPAEPAHFHVGSVDIMDRFRPHEGKNITLIISDEPVNMLDLN